MEGWRQRRLGWTETNGRNHGKSKKLLTGIGLLMEGVDSPASVSVAPEIPVGQLDCLGKATRKRLLIVAARVCPAAVVEKAKKGKR